MSNMSNLCTVTASSTLMPNGDMKWTVNTGDDLKSSLVYTNLMYDIVGVAIGKLGVEYSKWLLDQDDDRLAEAVAQMQSALRAGTVVG